MKHVVAIVATAAALTAGMAGCTAETKLGTSDRVAQNPAATAAPAQEDKKEEVTASNLMTCLSNNRVAEVFMGRFGKIEIVTTFADEGDFMDGDFMADEPSSYETTRNAGQLIIRQVKRCITVNSGSVYVEVQAQNGDLIINENI